MSTASRRKPSRTGAAALAAGLLIAAAPAYAAIRGNGVGAEMEAWRVTERPHIDGRLDDDVWAQAPVASNFTQRYPNEGAAPTEETEVRVVYDDHALYFAIRCFDSKVSSISRPVSRRDEIPESDSVTVAIDSLHDHATARAFTVNAAGVVSDQVLYNDTEESRDWDAVWDAAVSVDEGGWSAELAIPFRALRYGSAEEQVWGINVSRTLFRTKEISNWVMTPRSERGVVSRFGHLVGLEHLPSTRSLELIPYAAGRVERGTDRPGLDGTAGLDLRYGLTSGLTLDATLNPDFGQVEADAATLNLSTFETFYPEKRPFFLEGWHLFQGPLEPDEKENMQLFYSRRVGRAPSSPDLADGEKLLAKPGPATIAGAAKITGQLSGGWEMAAFNAVTLPVNAGVVTDHGEETRVLAPLTNYGALRLRRELGNGSVGGTFTSVRPVESGLASCPTHGRPVGGRCASGSETLGVDWLLRPSGLVVAGQLVASRVAVGAERLLPSGVTLRPGDVGVGAQVTLAREDGENVLFAMDLAYASARLDLNDAGFLERQGYLRQKGRLTLRTLKPRWMSRESAVHLDVTARQGAAGTYLGADAELVAEAGLSNFWWTGFSTKLAPSSWDDRELGDGALLWRPPSATARYWLNTDARKPFYLEGEAWYSHGFDDAWGQLRAWGTESSLVMRASSRYLATVSVGVQKALDPARYVATDGGQYLLAPLDSRSMSFTLRQSLALSPRLTLESYSQLFFASGATRGSYMAAREARVGRDSVLPGDSPAGPEFHEGLLNLTAVLRWEFSPGSTASLVYQRSQFEPGDEVANGIVLGRDIAALGGGVVNDLAMLKLTWWLGL